MDSFLASTSARGKLVPPSDTRSDRVSALLQPIVITSTDAGAPATVDGSAMDAGDGDELLSAIAAELDEPTDPLPLAWYAPLRPVTAAGCALESDILGVFERKTDSSPSVFVPFLSATDPSGSFHVPYAWHIDALDALHPSAEQGTEASPRSAGPSVVSHGITLSVGPKAKEAEKGSVAVSLSVVLERAPDHHNSDNVRKSACEGSREIVHPSLLVPAGPSSDAVAVKGSLGSLQLALGVGYTAAFAALRAIRDDVAKYSNADDGAAHSGLSLSVTVHAHLAPSSSSAQSHAAPSPVLNAAAAAAALVAASFSSCMSVAELTVAAAASRSAAAASAAAAVAATGVGHSAETDEWEWARALLPTVTFSAAPPAPAVRAIASLVAQASHAAGSAPVFAPAHAIVSVPVLDATAAGVDGEARGAAADANDVAVAAATAGAGAVNVSVSEVDWDVFATLSRIYCPLFLAIAGAGSAATQAPESGAVPPRPSARPIATPYAAWPGLLLSAVPTLPAPACASTAAVSSAGERAPEEEPEVDASIPVQVTPASEVSQSTKRHEELAHRLSMALLAKTVSKPGSSPSGISLPPTLGAFITSLAASDPISTPAARARAAAAAAVRAPFWPFLDSPLAIAHAAAVTAAAALSADASASVLASGPLPLSAAVELVAAVVASDAVNDAPYSLPFLSALLRAQPQPQPQPGAGDDQAAPWPFVLASRLIAPPTATAAAGPTLFPSRPAPAAAAGAAPDVKALAGAAGADLSDLSVLMRLASQGAASAPATSPAADQATVEGSGFAGGCEWVSGSASASSPATTAAARARALALTQLPASARALLPLLPAVSDAVTVGTFLARGRPTTATVVAADAAQSRPWWGHEKAGIASTVAVVGVKEAAKAACEEAKALMLQV